MTLDPRRLKAIVITRARGYIGSAMVTAVGRCGAAINLYARNQLSLSQGLVEGAR
jgi:hypothetical protein